MDAFRPLLRSEYRIETHGKNSFQNKRKDIRKRKSNQKKTDLSRNKRLKANSSNNVSRKKNLFLILIGVYNAVPIAAILIKSIKFCP